MSRVSSSATKRIGSYSSSTFTSPHYVSSYHGYNPSLGSGYTDKDKLIYKPAYTSCVPHINSGRAANKYALEVDRGRQLPRPEVFSRRSESLSRAPFKAFPSGLSGGYSTSYSIGSSHSTCTSPGWPLSRRKSISQTDLNQDLLNLHMVDTYQINTVKSPPLSRHEVDLHQGSRRSGIADPYYTKGSGAYALPRSMTQEAITASFKSTDRFNPAWERSGSSSSCGSPIQETPETKELIIYFSGRNLYGHVPALIRGSEGKRIRNIILLRVIISVDLSWAQHKMIHNGKRSRRRYSYAVDEIRGARTGIPIPVQRYPVEPMPSMRQSYTVTVPEEPVLSLFSKELRRKSPSVSGSMLVSTFVGLLINQAKHSKTSQGLVGLRNLGNTCFMNSILQCLSNTRELRDYCVQNIYRRELNSHSRTNTSLMAEFARLLQALWTSPNNDPISPSEFKAQIQKYAPRFVGYNQQDAQEFLRFLLDGLHNEVNRMLVRSKALMEDLDHLNDDAKSRRMWKKYLEREDSRIVDLFVGQLKSSLTCSECGFCSTAFDPFWDLSLPISKKGCGEVSLIDCIRMFTKEDILDGDEKPTCYRCKVRRKCTKKFTIQKSPKILVLHLKRFSETQIHTNKLSTFVNFPLKDLDLREFSSDNSVHTVYNLYAVSNHSGTTLGGHYTAYCKNPQSGEWYNFNDTRVTPMSSSQLRTSDAYVLFYELSCPSSRI